MEKRFGAGFKEMWADPEAGEHGDSTGDYLQDPELWRDRLPQPFRMLDRLLQELLTRAWREIDSRRLERETERDRTLPLEPVDLDRYFPQTIVEPRGEMVEGADPGNNLFDDLQLRLTEFHTKL